MAGIHHENEKEKTFESLLGGNFEYLFKSSALHAE